MPATTQEALSTPLLSLMQKMRYRSFLSNVLPMEIPGENGVPADKDVPLMHMTMGELYKKYSLDENCQEFTGHAMALRLNDDYLNETVKAMKLYGYSLNQYGSSPFLYPMYGLGGLPEGFSRLCAIKGGVFMLNRNPDELLFDDDGHIKGVASGGEAASCEFVVGDPSYFPDDMLCILAGLTPITFGRFALLALFTRPWGLLFASALGGASLSIPLWAMVLIGLAGVMIFVLGMLYGDRLERAVLKRLGKE